MTQQTIPADAVGDGISARQRWMRTLTAADPGALAAAWQDWTPKPDVQAIRGPETGLVMVRGRADGGGARFNLGEATVTRATVRLRGGQLSGDATGTSYVLGTDPEHARLAAIFDGLLTDARQRMRVLAEVIVPLDQERAEREAARSAEARSTRVDFFTVARENS